MLQSCVFVPGSAGAGYRLNFTGRKNTSCYRECSSRNKNMCSCLMGLFGQKQHWRNEGSPVDSIIHCIKPEVVEYVPGGAIRCVKQGAVH